MAEIDRQAAEQGGSPADLAAAQAELQEAGRTLHGPAVDYADPKAGLT